MHEGGQRLCLCQGLAAFNLIDEYFAAQIFMQQDRSNVVRCDRGLRCNACQGTEMVWAVGSLLGRVVEGRGSDQEYCLGSTGRDDGFVGQVGFERKAPGAIGLYQDIVCYLCKVRDRDGRGGEFIMSVRGSQTEAAVAAQGRG